MDCINAAPKRDIEFNDVMQRQNRLVDGQLVIVVVTGDIEHVEQRAGFIPVTRHNALLAINLDNASLCDDVAARGIDALDQLNALLFYVIGLVYCAAIIFHLNDPQCCVVCGKTHRCADWITRQQEAGFERVDPRAFFRKPRAFSKEKVLGPIIKPIRKSG